MIGIEDWSINDAIDIIDNYWYLNIGLLTVSTTLVSLCNVMQYSE